MERLTGGGSHSSYKFGSFAVPHAPNGYAVLDQGVREKEREIETSRVTEISFWLQRRGAKGRM